MESEDDNYKKANKEDKYKKIRDTTSGWTKENCIALFWKLIYILVVIILFLIIFLQAYFILGKGDEAKPFSNTSDESTTTDTVATLLQELNN